MTVQELIQIFKANGDVVYGEAMSVNSHSIQAGLLAKMQGFSEELQLAAFLHDIGHLMPEEDESGESQMMGEFGAEQHDVLGAHYLKELGCSPVVVACTKNHVDAKRYLCFAEKGYYEQLSDASKATLEYQGGPMSEEEAKAFSSSPFFEASIAIRRLDEEAKEGDFQIQNGHWDYFEDLLDIHLNGYN